MRKASLIRACVKGKEAACPASACPPARARCRRGEQYRNKAFAPRRIRSAPPRPAARLI